MTDEELQAFIDKWGNPYLTWQPQFSDLGIIAEFGKLLAAALEIAKELQACRKATVANEEDKPDGLA